MAESIARQGVHPGVLGAATLAPDENFLGLEMRLFGQMEVRVGGQPLPRLRSQKELWLLALLALRVGYSVERDWLAATLWPDASKAEAQRNLDQSLNDLHVALGPEAKRLGNESPQTIRLDLSDLSSGAWVDVLAFDAATTIAPDAQQPERDRNEQEAAIRLYRGPLLKDCTETWVLDERRQREQQYVTTLETLAATARAFREYTDETIYLRLALSVAPLREDLQRALMESLAVKGSVSAALQVFRQYRTRLWQERATEPDAETTVLYWQLQAEARKKAMHSASVASPASPEVSAAGSSLPALPQPRTVLIGREGDAEEVITRFAQARLVTLTGTGGIGKTRLALRVAESLSDEFENGVQFVDLAPLSDPEGVPETVCKALGLPQTRGQASPIEALRQYLLPRRQLIVLDNCEQVLPACATLADTLLTTCPGLRILATSRQALGLPKEEVWRVPSLSLPPPSAQEAEYANYSAVRLFVARAHDASPSFAVTPQNTPPLLNVCRRLDGIPLALELAAARVRILPLEEIDTRLNDQFRLLTGGDRTALPRQQTLRGALDWSWNLLTEPEQTLLARLSVFAGGWTQEAAEAICSDEAIPESDILPLMLSLQDKSLLQVEKQEDDTTRYRLLEPVRQYGRDRLAQRGSDAVGTTRFRHQVFFAALGKAAAEKRGTEKAAWLDRLDTEHDNLRVALEWQGYSPETRQAAALTNLRLAGDLESFWLARGYLREGRERLRAALAFAEAAYIPKEDVAYKRMRAHSLKGLASQERDMGDYPASQQSYEASLALYRQLDDTANVAAMVSELGLLAHFQNDFDRAQSLLEEGLAAYREMDDRRCIAISLSALGVLAGDRGELDKARSFLEESLALQREIGEERGIAVTLTNLGINARYRGDYTAAQRILQEALALHRETGNQRSIGIALLNLGGVASDLSDYDTSVQLLSEALEIFRTAGNKKGTAATLTTLGATSNNLGNQDQAIAQLQEALRLHRDLGDKQNLSTTLHAIASVRAEQDQILLALRLWGAAEVLLEVMGIPLRLGDRIEYEQMVAAARARIEPEVADAAWAEGRTLNIDAACDLALG